MLKYTHSHTQGSFTIRRLWVRPSEDNPTTGRELVWGDVKTLKVKGKMDMRELVDVWSTEEDENEAKADEEKFALFAKARTLDVESSSPFLRKKWVAAFHFFMLFKDTAVK
jgi:hypothetical protein